MLVTSTSDVLLLKVQLGSCPWKEGQACLERQKLEHEKPSWSCIAVSFPGFPPGLPRDHPLAASWSSRAEAGAFRDSGRQGLVGGSRGAQGVPASPQPAARCGREPGWHSTAKPPAHKQPKSLLTGKAGAAAIETLGKLCRAPHQDVNA